MKLMGVSSFRGMSVLERFEAQYIPEPMSGCWLWIGSVRREEKPYGQIGVNGKIISAHRLSYQIHNGEIPDGLWVLHKCDNPACVNPDHLFLGTGNDNVADRGRKGRTARGPSHGSAKLTYEQADAIRASNMSVDHWPTNGELTVMQFATSRGTGPMSDKELTTQPTSAEPWDDLARDQARSKAAKLLEAKGWKPGDSFSITAMLDLMVEFAEQASTITDRCGWSDCGCDHDARCLSSFATQPTSAVREGKVVTSKELVERTSGGWGEPVDTTFPPELRETPVTLAVLDDMDTELARMSSVTIAPQPAQPTTDQAELPVVDDD